jgi:hypothetical protein
MARKKNEHAEKHDAIAAALVALQDAETIDELAAVVAVLSSEDKAAISDDIRAAQNRIKNLAKGF